MEHLGIRDDSGLTSYIVRLSESELESIVIVMDHVLSTLDDAALYSLILGEDYRGVEANAGLKWYRRQQPPQDIRYTLLESLGEMVRALKEHSGDQYLDKRIRDWLPPNTPE